MREMANLRAPGLFYKKLTPDLIYLTIAVKVTPLLGNFSAVPVRAMPEMQQARKNKANAPHNEHEDAEAIADGEMRDLIEAFDWSRSSLGPMTEWPQTLKTALNICLRSRFQLAIYWGPELVLLYNDAERSALGALHPQALGKPAREVLVDMWDVVRPMLYRVLECGEATWSVDQPLMIDRCGLLEEAFFTWSYSPIPDDVGTIRGVLLVTKETTQQVLAERRLRTLRELAAGTAAALDPEQACAAAMTILSQNPDDIPFASLYLVDTTGSVKLCSSNGPCSSPTAERFPFEEVTRQRAALQVSNLGRFFDSGVAPKLPKSAFILPLFEHGVENIAGFLVAGVGDHRKLDSAYRSFFDMLANQIAAALALANARELERIRNNAIAELDRAKTAFFTNVSHEFRTPLTLILSTLDEVLNRSSGSLSEVDCERVQMALRNGMRLQKLVDCLLDFSRIEASRMEAHFELTDLSGLTSELASVFRSAIESAGMAFSVDCPPLPGPAYVDREMWEKIVLNLLSNALKYTLDGEIQVLLRQADETIELSICDTGVGIPETELPLVFERFHRVAGTHGRTMEGTGIGLALVHELVKLHGGSIRVESTYRKGSTFTVAIPVGIEHLPGGRIKAPGPPGINVNPKVYLEEAFSCLGKPTPSKPPNKVSARRVLVVDDNADMRDYITSLLSADYEVVAVGDGRAALVEALRSPPALVLADVMMPHLGGFELLAALRTNAKTKTVPVLVLSARAGEEDKIEGLTKGADGYLTKPFSARELRARVASQIELAQLRHDLGELDRRRMQDELARMNRAIEMGKMLASVTHELAQPLAAIHSNAQAVSNLLARPTPALAEIQSALADIVDDGHRARMVLDHVRAFLKKHTVTPHRVNLNSIVEDVKRIVENNAHMRGVQFELALSSHEVFVQGDEVPLQQVLINLVNNAMEAVGNLPAERRVFTVKTAVEGNRKCGSLVVEDEGPGVPDELRATLFEPFFTTKTEGLGMGLSICKEILACLGGSIQLENRPTRGAVFRVELPLTS
jgi:signal transduction histidine kinase